MTTNPPVYIPRTGSLADRVLDYFRQCPDEELSQADVAAKFDAQRSSVGSCLKPTVDAGLLAWGHNSELEYVYTLPGKPAARSAVTPAATRISLADALGNSEDLGRAMATAAAKHTPARGRTKLPPSALDFSTLQVDHGMPLTGKSHGTAGTSKWAPLFAKLTEPDTSVEFPATWKSAVAAQATKLNVAHKKAGNPTEYKVRITEPGKARIWRLA